MSRRIDIELTSVREDGSWTWRAAGAREPRGVIESELLPAGVAVGDILKVDVVQEIDGIMVQAVVQGRQKIDRRELLELVVNDDDFVPVTEQRAEKRRRPEGERRRPRRRDGEGRGDGDGRGRGDGSSEQRRARPRRDGEGGRGSASGTRRPSFTPPAEVPSRPKPKRLRPRHEHRAAVLASIPDERRAIAEVALQGMPAVRQRLAEENQRLAAEGRPTMPEQPVMKMAEELLPRLRLAEWLDRAEAASNQADDVDLRDLRSVVAAAADPIVTRDDRARQLATELQGALARRQERELDLWYGEIDALLAAGRVIRALRLSSKPPKAGVRFPADIAQRLTLSANSALAPADGAERWVGVLEAAAFSPVRSAIAVTALPQPVSDELRATVTRLGPLLPQVAAAFGIEVEPGATPPKPLPPVRPSGREQERRPSRGPGRRTPDARNSESVEERADQT